ncbi:MAG: radical SAM protein, partial [Chlamydiia bacterium]|nr:radical SAM protein [Chlamydiia bacterium]
MMGLVDRFGRIHTYLRISVTDRCNLRCQYCMPAEGIEWRKREEILTFEEIVRVAQVFVDLGIRKIRITGGEPLVRKGIEDLIAQLAILPELKTLAMTTNGVLLQDKASSLKAAGLQGLNVSLDSLKRERFSQITKRDDYDKVMDGIR